MRCAGSLPHSHFHTHRGPQHGMRFISTTRLCGAPCTECAWGGSPGLGLRPYPAYFAIRVKISGGECGRGCVAGGSLRARGDRLFLVSAHTTLHTGVPHQSYQSQRVAPPMFTPSHPPSTGIHTGPHTLLAGARTIRHHPSGQRSGGCAGREALRLHAFGRRPILGTCLPLWFELWFHTMQCNTIHHATP